MKRLNTLFVYVLAFHACALLPQFAAVAEEAVAAITPESRLGQKWWAERFVLKLTEKDARRDEIGLVFIGDSITHGFEGSGSETWEQYFAKYGALNIGYSGDRTEHVVWRLQHGEVEGLDPKGAVIMIGTNNTGHSMEAAEHTSAGVGLILDELKKRLPKTKVLLLGIFPRSAKQTDAMRVLNDDINARLEKFGRRRKVTYLNINSVFLTDDGELTKEVMPDLLHPKEMGYKLWADAIAPAVQEMMEK